MIDVLIAEDELLIRMGLESSIPWSELGFHIIASVSDGQKAWDAYQSNHPEVVITDIRMPKLDGLELVKRIRQESSTCKIIIITCIEDFKVLSRSLNLDITGCLQKANITYNELFKLLNQVKKELEDLPKRQVESHDQQAHNTEWFHLYLVDQTISLDELNTRTTSLHMYLTATGYLLTVSHGLINKVLAKSIASILREDLSFLGNLLITNNEDKIYIYIQPQQTITLQMITSVMDNLCKYIKDIFSLYLRFTFASVDKFSDLPAIAVMSNHYLAQPYFFPEQGIHINGTEPYAVPYDILDRFRNNPSCYAFFKKEPAARYFEIIDKIKESYGTSKSIFVSQLSALVDFITEVCFIPDLQEALRNFSNISYQNAPAALEALYNLVPKYSPNPLYAAGMLNSIQFIHENYMTPISLTQLAGMLNVSTNYYAILFRKVIGYNFTDFLLGIRMYHARRLLRDTKFPISQVSERCGFTDAAYFSKIFRRHFKMTPHQYRTPDNDADSTKHRRIK